MKTKMFRNHAWTAVNALMATAGCLLWMTAPAAAVSVVRGPYLQLSSPTNITICWRTDAPTDSRVVYGPGSAGLGFTNESPVLETNHFVTLTGLEPDTRYYYALGSTEKILAGPGLDYTFLTHPWPGTEKPIRVWVIGDAGVSAAGGLLARNQRAVRDAFVKFNGTNAVHAWLQLGDNDQYEGTDAGYQVAQFNVYPQQLRQWVTWPTLGNHDTDQRTAFVDTYPYFGIFHLPTAGEAGGVPSGTEHYYSFDLGMVHFICLDSMTASRASSGAMATWLRADLAANSNRWTVAYWHHPPYTKGGYDSDARDALVEMRESLVPILEHGGVDLVMCGHSHVYERSCLVDGHYGIAATFDPDTMLVQGGDGYGTNGEGAYLKPDSLGRPAVPRKGTVYVVAGCSGKLVTTGNLNHPIMVNSQRTLGSVVLDFASNRLDVVFLPMVGPPADRFSIIKEGVQPTRILEVTPPGAFVNEGDDVSFAVIASGSPPLAYRWQFNGGDLAGATESTLALSNVVFAQAGEYSVVVSGPGGTASSNLVLAVNRAPIAQVGNLQTPVISANGSNAVVALDGSWSSDPDDDPLTYEWFVTGAVIPFASGPAAITSLPVGSNWLTLVVRDGKASAGSDFVVEVIRVSEAMDRLSQVARSGADRPEPLLATLRAARAASGRDQPAVAINQLEAFKHQVLARLMSADPEMAAQLITAAEAVIKALDGDESSDAPVRITGIRAGRAGGAHLNIHGQGGRPVVVESSTNLVDWMPAGVARPCGESAFEFEDRAGASTGARYYRVRRP